MMIQSKSCWSGVASIVLLGTACGGTVDLVKLKDLGGHGAGDAVGSNTMGQGGNTMGQGGNTMAQGGNSGGNAISTGGGAMTPGDDPRGRGRFDSLCGRCGLHGV